MSIRIATVESSTYGPIFNITIAKSNLVLDAAKKAGHEVAKIYGYNTTYDHCTKQCIDFMYYRDHELRDWLVDFLIRNEDELGVEGIICNREVMGFPSNGTWYRGPEGEWRPYSGPNPHTDHVHVHFNTDRVNGALDTPRKKRRKPKHWSGNLWVVKDAPAYDGTGKRRPECDLKKGERVHGTVDSEHFNDGRYFRIGKVPHRLWFPLDSGNFSHEKHGDPIREGGRSTVSEASLRALVRAARRDPDRKQGGTTKHAADDVRVVEDALRREGLLPKRWSSDGSFGSATVKAYAKWQRRLGYRGKDADGIPGRKSLEKLGHKYGFDVTK